MATFDSGVRFDAGARFDVTAAATKPHKMSKPKLELRLKADAEILAFARAHITAMTGNPNFPAPEPAPAALLAAVDAYETALNEAIAASAAAQTKTSAKDAQRAALELLLTQRAASVEIQSGGEETKILSAGFGVRASASPVGAMAQPQNFRATMGDLTGEIDLQWDPVRGAKSYILECRTHGATPGAWQQVKIVTSSKYSAQGLTPGQEYAFRVRAVGTAGEGPWSDEAVKMAAA